MRDRVEIVKPLLLDLFCGAGGAAMGYHRAGFDVVGVDINPQPNYPFRFLHGDALEALRYLWNLDTILPHAIHASPPCQHYTNLARGTNNNIDSHPNLIPKVRDLLDQTGLPYVIENVPGASIRDDLTLCGLSFGLRVFRHRKFETGGWAPERLKHEPHKGHRVAGYRHGKRYDGDMFAVYGCGGDKGTIEQWQLAMGIDWTRNRKEIAEAIPPAYTEYIGRQLIEHLGG